VSRTLQAYVQAAPGEPQAVPGLVVCVQTFRTVATAVLHRRGEWVAEFVGEFVALSMTTEV
jgi:hypothetical protein